MSTLRMGVAEARFADVIWEWFWIFLERVLRDIQFLTFAQ